MDHRAVEQAGRINQTGSGVLRNVGGTISPEMETPKLLWLRENRPAVFDAAWQFFDLTDFLTWKASGSLARSACTVTCKWTYLAHEERWDPDYFRTIGLGVLVDEGFGRIGREIVVPGTPLGQGLTEAAAIDLGLLPGTPIAAGLIDAHAGGIGTVGAQADPVRTMGYVFGTSSCTMTTTRHPVLVPGVWGPYFSAMVPGMWLNEGGQSAAGAAIDQLVSFHPAATEAARLAAADGLSLPEWLAGRAEAHGRSEAIALAGGLHVVPEFLGNRAPFADPHARAAIAGLGLERDLSSLVALYVAGIAGLGYGLRQIVEIQARHGAPIEFDRDQRWRRPPFVDPPDPRRRYRPPHRHYRSRGARATRLGRPCCRGRRRVTRHPRGHGRHVPRRHHLRARGRRHRRGPLSTLRSVPSPPAYRPLSAAGVSNEVCREPSATGRCGVQ